MVNVAPIRRNATALSQRLLITECPEETAHRVACVLRYLAVHARDNCLGWTDDEEFGRMILLKDLAAALDYARAVAHE
jgi:hypothetical protein